MSRAGSSRPEGGFQPRRLSPEQRLRFARMAAEWLVFRDRPHQMLMQGSLCKICYGFVDDYRHSGYPVRSIPRY